MENEQLFKQWILNTWLSSSLPTYECLHLAWEAGIKSMEEPSPHAALIAQCEQDKKQFPEFWNDLYQLKNSDGKWCGFGKNWVQANFKSEFEYRQHPHCANIIAWHACSEEDKKRWQAKKTGVSLSIWFDVEHSGVMCWLDDYEYRLRPKVCSLTLQNGTAMEWQDPVRYPLEIGQAFFTVSNKVSSHIWANETWQNEWLDKGWIQLTKQAADQHFAVLQAINNQRAKPL